MTRARVAALVLALALGGCAHYPLNERLSRWDGPTGYRFQTLDPGPGNTDSLFVCLSFSGGGTRAAAFAYGVMQALRDTPIVWHGQPTTLLGEVDCISSVSGGSFTAAYYALFRDEFFPGFERNFLARNITHELVLKALNPVNLVRLMSPRFSRIDLAAELYDETVFRQAKFQSLIDAHRRPFIIVNATDTRNGTRFEFTQGQFDFLGSTLASYPVSRAVAASSAFPFLLSPLTLKAYGPAPGFVLNDEYTTAMADFHISPLRYHWARPQLEYLDPARVRYVHLLDGGLADNIGLRSVQRAYAATDGFLFSRPGIERLVIIAVNAKTDPDDDSSQSPRPPGLLDVALKTATVSMDNYSFETVDTVRNLMREQEMVTRLYEGCAQLLEGNCPPNVRLPPISPTFKTCVVEVSFDAISDPVVRRQFLNLPTSFDLSPDQLRAVIDMGGTLLRQSPYFVSLVRQLGGDVAGAPERLDARCE